MDEASFRIQSLEAELARLRKELDELRQEGPDQLLRALMDQAPDQIYFKDLNSRFIRVSRAVAKSFRMADPEQLKGMSDFDFFSEGHANQAYGDEQDIIRTGQPRVDIEEPETWPDGSVTWVSTTKLPLRAANGAILGTFGISRDITRRKRAEEALRASEERFRMIFDHGVDGILMGSPEGFIIGANDAAFIMAGRSKNDLMGLHISRIFTAESQARVPFRFDLLKAGHRVVSERDLLRPDGSTLAIEMHTKMMPDGTYQAIVRDISERRRSEAALRESEASYRGLFDSVMEDIYIQDREGRFLDVNRSAEQTYGRPREFFLGQTPEVVSAPGMNDLGGVAEYLQRAFKGEAQRFEFWGIRANGDVFPKEVRLYRGAYFGNEVVIALAQDISQRKTAEKAIQDSERHYRELLERLAEGFAFTDTCERFVFANPAASAIFGVDDGLVGHQLSEFVAPEVLADVARRTEARRRGERGHYELPIRRPDGRERILSLSVTPWVGEDGTFLGSSGLFQDITEQKQAEAALREAEERYRELFNNTTDAIFWIKVEPDGSLLLENINPAEETRTGLKNAELSGKRIEAILPGPQVEPVVANYRRCLAEGVPIRYEEQVDLPSGRKTFLTLLVPIRDANGTFTRIVGFSQDVTQSKQAEEALRQAQKLESLGVLAGGIAHDFNNLLTAILGNLNLAQAKGAPESPSLPYLENVERTVLKAAELTKQMLAYSGKGRFIVKLHDLNQVVQEMTHLLNVSISKKVVLRYELARELPPVEADAAQIQQVVMNLVTNASEAIGDREGTITVGTRTEFLDETALQAFFPGQDVEPGACAVLEISDSGCGIDPQIMSRIFDPFFSTKQSGRGLGLSAMLGILRGHHAGIRIASEPGEGSTFTLYFPATQGSVTSDPLGVAVPQVRNFHGRVLLADDEEDVRFCTEAMLQVLGFEVVTARDGREALERFSERSFDLVLLDLTMPRMDGREAFHELRRAHARLPVILYSGYTEHESIQEILEQGLAAFLQKPFQLSELRQAVQQVLPRP